SLFFFQAEDGIRDWSVTGVQTCALPISALNQHGIEVIDKADDLNPIARKRLNLWRHPAANDAKNGGRHSLPNKGPDTPDEIGNGVGIGRVLITADEDYSGACGEGCGEGCRSTQFVRVGHERYDVNKRTGRLTSDDVGLLVGQNDSGIGSTDRGNFRVPRSLSPFKQFRLIQQFGPPHLTQKMQIHGVENNASPRHQLANDIEVSASDFDPAQDHEFKIPTLLNKKVTHVVKVGSINCFHAHGLKRIGIFSLMSEIVFRNEGHSKTKFIQYSDNINTIS